MLLRVEGFCTEYQAETVLGETPTLSSPLRLWKQHSRLEREPVPSHSDELQLDLSAGLTDFYKAGVVTSCELTGKWWWQCKILNAAVVKRDNTNSFGMGRRAINSWWSF